MTPTNRTDIDATADEIATILGIDPERVGVDYRNHRIELSHGSIRRLLVLAQKGQARE